MANTESTSFSIPEGFTEEQVEGQLYHEDLNEDDEIWLIRMSSDIELSDLDRKKIWLSNDSGEVNVSNITTENGKLLECYSENCETPNLCVVLPKKCDERLHAVKTVIKGTILISEGLVLDENVEIKSECKSELKENVFDSASECKRKRDKKKKKCAHDFNNSDLNYETDYAEIHSNTHIKKHSGVNKKGNSEKMDIKAEPLSMDWDGFPQCVSQK